MNTQISVTEQGNFLIAKFMGFTYPNGKDAVWYCYQDSHKYHKDWNLLMPVIEKISKIPLQNLDGTPCTDTIDTCYPITFNMPTTDGSEVMFRFKGFSVHTETTLIKVAWEACIEVIQFINTQHSK